MSFFKKISFVSAALFLLACTDYVADIDEQIEKLEAKQSRTSSNIEAVVSHEDLPSFCDEEGSTVYVKDEDVDYVCIDGAWHPPISSSSSFAKSSSSEKIESSSSSSSFNQFNPDIKYGELLDSRDGQTYKTVKIGSQTWMAQNLNYETANSFCYSDNASNCTKYGRLYTWAAAVGKSENECGYGYSCSLPQGDIQGICPSGWHLPSITEWENLFNAVGGQRTAGKGLKSSFEWPSSGCGTDDFGFSALPAGSQYDGWSYHGEGNYAHFWSSTEVDSNDEFAMYLDYNDDIAHLLGEGKNYGYSVRCLKNDASGQSAQSSGFEGVATREDLPSSCDEEGSTIYVEDEGVDYVCKEGTWHSPISSSSSSAKSSSSVKSSSSSEDSGPVEGTLTDSRDGQTYKTVKIGSQTWMAENLNFKTDSSFCYSNNETNCTTYGRLYTWTAAVSACPSGWHLPSYDEWNTLFTAVGGASTAGPVLRATSGWYGNGNGLDNFGFSALPAGNYDQGYFNNREDEASFWMADEFNSESASYARLRYWEAYVYLGDHYKHYGLSVRCLKD